MKPKTGERKEIIKSYIDIEHEFVKPISELLEKLQNIVKQYPNAYYNKCYAGDCWDEDSIELCYNRQETPKEKSKRLAKSKRAREARLKKAQKDRDQHVEYIKQEAAKLGMLKDD